MPKFTVKKNRFSSNKVQFWNLVIDGEDQFDKFEEQLENKYRSKLKRLATYISRLSEKKDIPFNTKKKIKGHSDTIELKASDLRLYYLKIEKPGLVVCLIGLKKNQTKDLRRVISLRKQILNQIEREGKLKIEKGEADGENN